MILSGWGRYSREACKVHSPRSEEAVRQLVEQGSLIARGKGRGYGDCAQNAGATLDMRAFNRMIGFDPARGQVVAEAGVLLQDVIETFLPRGWFPAVTPGTKFVTLGGMVAADVHGKNHHLDGSFGAFIDWIDVLGADGDVRRCSRSENPELFGWTIGGMGLTGVIIRLAFRLRAVQSGWIKQTTHRASDLGQAFDLFEENSQAPYSVAWIDCLASGRQLGRSAIMLGDHVPADDLPETLRADPFATPPRKALRVPCDAPIGLLNRLTVKAFNALYYRYQSSAAGERLVAWDSYFYPLDALIDWNRIYGRSGFLQFQCVLPLASANAGLSELLEAISRAGQSSFLAVLKRLGCHSTGGFSFPLEGYTLALDMPVTRSALELLERLDAIVIAHGGRFYLAKDARMSARTLRESDPRVPAFEEARRTLGVRAFESSQSRRLAL
jgi:FAD/FMN-containing dehydrogenase